MNQNYTVSDPDQTWSIDVELESTDVEAIHTHMTTPQIIQICRDTIERAVRLALGRQKGIGYDNFTKIDPDTLNYVPARTKSS